MRRIHLWVVAGLALTAAIGAMTAHRPAQTCADGMMPEVLARAEAPRLVMPEVIVRPAAAVAAGPDSPASVN
jgi:hypothetical protein